MLKIRDRSHQGFVFWGHYRVKLGCGRLALSGLVALGHFLCYLGVGELSAWDLSLGKGLGGGQGPGKLEEPLTRRQVMWSEESVLSSVRGPTAEKGPGPQVLAMQG